MDILPHDCPTATEGEFEVIGGCISVTNICSTAMTDKRVQ